MFGSWDHIAFSWDGATANHYVNGSLVDTDTNTPGITTINDFGSTFSISRLSSGAYGIMDDIKFLIGL